LQEECFYFCPHCLQRVSTIVDLSQHNQEYIEDCEVCCNPLVIQVFVDEDGRVSCEAAAAQ
jgi:hypothetical protein